MSSLLPHLPVFLAVLFRVGGLFVFAPVLSSPAIAPRIKILLVVMLSIAVYPTVPHPAIAPFDAADVFSLLPTIAGESLLGAAIGLMAALPIYAVQLGGVITGQQVGFGLGSIYNPALDTESDSLSQLLLYLAVAAFLLIGGLDASFACVADTFRNLPPGTAGLSLAPLDLFTGLMSSGFNLALRVAAPVLGIILLETVASAVLMKTIPQINILSIGFAIKIVVSLVVLTAAAASMHEAATGDIIDTLELIGDWARSLTPAAR